ncbi:MAG: Sensory transduction protein LytT [Bacteroidetes bacterium]|jgi:two-component system LytT family response regulator|nr:Sensory transduction protein LytT [Bacteroidota bacterium]
MINAIIVDDEKNGRILLQLLLKQYCPNVNVIETASSVEQALELINKLNPDLLFLDIELTNGSGFDILNEIENPDFSVIFVTAYDKYAVKAFKFSAIDYLLKPVDEEELIRAVKQAEKHKKENQYPSIEALSKNYNTLKYDSGKLALTTQTGLVFIEIKDLIRCEADGKYTNCYLVNGSKIVVSRNLKEFEDFLSEHNFIRIHNSHLVNMGFIKQYYSGRGGYVLMSDGSTVDVSQRKKEEFLKRLNKI